MPTVIRFNKKRYLASGVNLSELFDQIPEPIAYFDADERLSACNLSFRNHFPIVIESEFLKRASKGAVSSQAGTSAPSRFLPPAVNPSGYAITKWMVIFQTRHMAQMLGIKNIRVNAVAPGVTLSPATKAVVPEPIIDTLVGAAALRSALDPEDHAGLIVFLASDESSKMTGQVLVNDAGTHFAA